jgi:hypothetical protein
MPALTNTNAIKMFMCCTLCLAEKPDDLSPREYAHIECGWTELGLQVWCVRHEVNICHVDFEGHKHPANTTRRLDA